MRKNIYKRTRFFENFLNFFSKMFRIFLFVLFVCSLARSFEKFSKFSSRRRDRFGPKIVQFRPILAIFRPFENSTTEAIMGHLPLFATLFPRYLKGKGDKLSVWFPSSNGRKITRTAPNSTIFGPNESSRRDLFLEKFRTNETNEKFSKNSKNFQKKKRKKNRRISVRLHQGCAVSV